MKLCDNVEMYNDDCLNILKDMDTSNKILVIDPPFNIGYKYNSYNDKLKEDEYLEWIFTIVSYFDKFVIINYPETMFKISIKLNLAPERVVHWVYNSNTKRQNRTIAFFNVTPDFSKVKQPYKNPNDKRIKKLIENGSSGTNIYDWWNINQIKNVSKEKTEHPCQMPVEVMQNIINLLPEDYDIVDCFLGSGTTGEGFLTSNKAKSNKFIGVEIDETYFNIAKNRIESIIVGMTK